ncbi:MAG: DUF429 domain-containing protein [Candidatus Methanospirareceae archaeon]
MKVIGIDLAGSEKNITGICVLEGDKVTKLFSLYNDAEILGCVGEEKPVIVAIDAPLSFYGKPFRDCDVEIRRYYRILPLTFYGMRRLTERGMRLKREIERNIKGVEVIEVYPYATRKSLCIDDEKVLRRFVRYKREAIKNKHEYDAILCALTAKFFKEGKYHAFGKKDRIIVAKSSYDEKKFHRGR